VGVDARLVVGDGGGMMSLEGKWAKVGKGEGLVGSWLRTLIWMTGVVMVVVRVIGRGGDEGIEGYREVGSSWVNVGEDAI
jgi:hypothetical protein